MIIIIQTETKDLPSSITQPAAYWSFQHKLKQDSNDMDAYHNVNGLDQLGLIIIIKTETKDLPSSIKQPAAYWSFRWKPKQDSNDMDAYYNVNDWTRGGTNIWLLLLFGTFWYVVIL